MSFSKYDNVDVLHAVERTATNSTTARIFGLVMAQITTPTLASPKPLGLTPEYRQLRWDTAVEAFLPIEDEQCCHGMVSIGVDKLDAYQDIPFGTPAHDKSYGRRNPSEKTISMIKDKGGLTPGWCRSFGLAAHTIGALALAIAHNLKQTLRVERTQTQKPTAPARPKNFEPTRRNILADSLTHGHRPTRHTARTRRRQ